MEENGTLAVGEKGCRNGQIPQVLPHANFRMFLTMDPRDGDLSPAMRNRGVEIAVMTESIQNEDEKMLECSENQNDISVSGNDLVKFGNSFVIWRQFCLMIDRIKMIDHERAILAFLSCNFEDWQIR